MTERPLRIRHEKGNFEYPATSAQFSHILAKRSKIQRENMRQLLTSKIRDHPQGRSKLGEGGKGHFEGKGGFPT